MSGILGVVESQAFGHSGSLVWGLGFRVSIPGAAGLGGDVRGKFVFPVALGGGEGGSSVFLGTGATKVA